MHSKIHTGLKITIAGGEFREEFTVKRGSEKDFHRDFLLLPANSAKLSKSPASGSKNLLSEISIDLPDDRSILMVELVYGFLRASERAHFRDVDV